MIKLIIITSFFCNGLRAAARKDMIFEGLRVKLKAKVAPYIYKPVIGCIYCMSSLYSIIFYSAFVEYSLDSIYELPIMICCVCALNGLICNQLKDLSDD